MKKLLLIIMVFLSACDSSTIKEKDYPQEVFLKQLEAVDTDMDYYTNGLIVPLYLYPSEERAAEFERVVTIKSIYPELPIIVIINPYNGPGEYSDNYRDLVEKYNNAGVSMIGYIYADYSNRPLNEIYSDIDQFKVLYPELDGLFVDEVDDGGSYDYYKSIYDYASDLDFMIGNPGTETEVNYFDIFNIIIIDERNYSEIDKSYYDKDSFRGVANFQKGILAHNVPDELDAFWLSEKANWLYISKFDTYSKLTDEFEEFSKLLVERNIR